MAAQPVPEGARRHRVVVVGGGFGGMRVVRGLRRAPVDVTVIDRQNFSLFQPLVYQVATGSLSAERCRCALSELRLAYQGRTRTV